MKGKITFQSSLMGLSNVTAADEKFKNETLKYCKFVFCDDKPNSNKHGVEYEDFPSIAASAIGTPIKMRFLGEGIGNHVGSIPIGHITQMEEITAEDGSHQLVAAGVLFAEDYPDEVTYLQKEYDEGRTPGVSWELGYGNTIMKEGITWFKDLVTKAATFVRNPSYGSKTALLALASDNTVSDEDFSNRLVAIANEIRPKNTVKGGNIKVEEELKTAKEALAKAVAERDEAIAKVKELETAQASLVTEKTELQTTVDTQKASIDAYIKKELVAKRTTAVAEAGISVESDAAKLEKKQEFWAGMSEEAFAEYVDDLKAAVKSAKGTSFASLRTASASATAAPKITAGSDDDSFANLKGRLGALSRSSQEVSE